jgi:hypothetical protein
MWVNNVINHTFGNGNHTTYKKDNSLGMLYGIVSPTFMGITIIKPLLNLEITNQVE